MRIHSHKLRSIGAISLGLVVLSGSFGQAQTGSLMSDPVFGITYDTRLVHFDRAPQSLERACAADLRGRGNFWLYAYWKEGDTEYLVISNRDSQESGGAAVIRGNKCTLGLPDWVLRGEAKFNPDNRDTSIRFTPAVLQGLSADLIRRYTAAFGGKKNFLGAVRRLSNFSPAADLPPAVAREFERFTKDP